MKSKLTRVNIYIYIYIERERERERESYERILPMHNEMRILKIGFGSKDFPETLKLNLLRHMKSIRVKTPELSFLINTGEFESVRTNCRFMV